jgi:hypothetical protein
MYCTFARAANPLRCKAHQQAQRRTICCRAEPASGKISCHYARTRVMKRQRTHRGMRTARPGDGTFSVTHLRSHTNPSDAECQTASLGSFMLWHADGASTAGESQATAAAPVDSSDKPAKTASDKNVRNIAQTFAPRASGNTGKNPATKGTVLYDIFTYQAWLCMAFGGLLSFNVVFPSDQPNIWRLMGCELLSLQQALPVSQM